MSHEYIPNWGNLTSYMILTTGLDQGEHASDPSGDGHGPESVDEPRAGLANIVEQGNMEATYDVIATLVGLPTTDAEVDLLLM